MARPLYLYVGDSGAADAGHDMVSFTEKCPPAQGAAGIGAEIARPVEPVRTVDPRTLEPPESLFERPGGKPD
jgi:hypothetical protein